MKRFLLLLALAAFLAIPSISMADGGIGVGVISSMTIKATALHDASAFSDSTTIRTTQSFVLKQGVLSFTVSQVSPADKTAGQAFNGEIDFTGGSASSTVLGKTTSISNVTMNLNGLMLDATQAKSAATSNGTVDGTINITDDSGTTTKSFTGSYSLNASLAGWVTDDSGTHPTSGTFAPMVIVISGVTSADDSVPPVITSEPVIVNVTVPTVPFKVVSATGNGNPAHNITGTWTATYTNTNTGESDVVTLSLTQTGNVVTGNISDPDHGSIPLSGLISGNGITMQFTDSVKGEAVTSKGTLSNADGSMSGTYTSTKGGKGTWSATKQ
jgi:hypothetical protein